MKIAARAIIVHDNKILLVRHHGRDFFALPGGHIDENENIQAALRRELKEELGLSAKIGRILFIHEFSYPDGHHSIEFFFLIDNADRFLNYQNGSHTEDEIADIAWQKIDDKLNIKPDFLKKELKNIESKQDISFLSFE